MAFWRKRYISKYTGKEIDDAIGKTVDAMENPMTAAGDIIIGGTDGEPEKLAKGTAGQFLVMNAAGSAPEWQTVPAANGQDF